jgi:gamma-glutamylputrescine oxidase
MSAEYIDCHYARTATPTTPRPPLSGDVEAEVCVVGGGLAGLSTALSLTERGKSVALVEARRIGWGASGRNGGFLSSGFACDVSSLVERVGLSQTRALYALSTDAVDRVKRRVAEHRIDCDLRETGGLKCWWMANADEARAEQEYIAETLGKETEFWPSDRVREHLTTTRYHDALFRRDAAQFHPLNYALGVGRAVEAKGGRIFETSPVTALELDRPEKIVTTAGGRIRAKTVVMACGGYIDGLEPRVSAALQPIATYVMVTEPLGERIHEVVRTPATVIDSRFDFDYWRPLPDTRLLWGGGVSTRRSDPPNLKQFMMNKLLAVFPQLRGIGAETAWGGLMGYPVHKMLQMGEVQPGAWYAMGFGGHGMGTTTLAGELVAAAIAEGDDRYRMFAPFGLTWAGGPMGRAYAQATFWYFALRDRFRG